jgi:hypothetical protein
MSNILAMNQRLNAGDQLESSNGAFFAIMQTDGNLCVYRKSAGSNAQSNALWCLTNYGPGCFAILQSDGNFCVYQNDVTRDGYRWGSQKTSGGGQFFLVLQDDGNLCVYTGTAPGTGMTYVWGTQAIDPVVDVQVASMDYDMKAATISNIQPLTIFSEEIDNGNDGTQKTTLQRQLQTSRTWGWNDAIAVKVTAKTSFNANVLWIVDGKVETSGEVSNTYTRNSSNSETNTWTLTVPVSAESGSKVKAIVTASQGTLTVPYSLSGTCTLTSGATAPFKGSGVYTEQNAFSLHTSFGPVSSSGAAPAVLAPDFAPQLVQARSAA